MRYDEDVGVVHTQPLMKISEFPTLDMVEVLSLGNMRRYRDWTITITMKIDTQFSMLITPKRRQLGASRDWFSTLDLTKVGQPGDS